MQVGHSTALRDATAANVFVWNCFLKSISRKLLLATAVHVLHSPIPGAADRKRVYVVQTDAAKAKCEARAPQNRCLRSQEHISTTAWAVLTNYDLCKEFNCWKL